MRWGPRKFKRVLGRGQPGRSRPSASTIGELLKREGLVVAGKKRRRTAPYTEPLALLDGFFTASFRERWVAVWWHRGTRPLTRGLGHPSPRCQNCWSY